VFLRRGPKQVNEDRGYPLPWRASAHNAVCAGEFKSTTSCRSSSRGSGSGIRTEHVMNTRGVIGRARSLFITEPEKHPPPEREQNRPGGEIRWLISPLASFLPPILTILWEWKQDYAKSRSSSPRRRQRDGPSYRPCRSSVCFSPSDECNWRSTSQPVSLLATARDPHAQQEIQRRRPPRCSSWCVQSWPIAAERF